MQSDKKNKFLIQQCDNNNITKNWANLPELVTKKILLNLILNDRYNASLVCQNWNYYFHSPKLWECFTITDKTLVKSNIPLINSEKQKVLDYERAGACLRKIGHCIKHLKLQCSTNFNVLYQFISLMTWHLKQNAAISNCKDGDVENIHIGSKIKILTYIFPCNIIITNGPYGAKLFGIEGQLLNALKQLFSKLQKLEVLKLIDLVLERYQTNHLFDTIHTTWLVTLKVLHIVNITMVHCPITSIGLFINLQILVISPHNIDDKILEILSESKLLHLYLLQNEHTPKNITVAACSSKAWGNFHDRNASIQVHLVIDVVRNDTDLVIQPNAPVYSVTYKAPYLKLKSDVIHHIANYYKATLKIFAQQGILRVHTLRSLLHRIDRSLQLLVNNCRSITTLVISSKISTCTVILIATTAKYLETFHVRKNAVVLKFDCCKRDDWPNEYLEWLKISSKSYQRTEIEVSKMLKKPWILLNDKLFKQIVVNMENRKEFLY